MCCETKLEQPVFIFVTLEDRLWRAPWRLFRHNVLPIDTGNDSRPGIACRLSVKVFRKFSLAMDGAIREAPALAVAEVERGRRRRAILSNKPRPPRSVIGPLINPEVGGRRVVSAREIYM